MRASYELQLDEINKEIIRLEELIFNAQFDDRLSLNDQEETYKRLVSLQASIALLQEKINSIVLEEADSSQFIIAVEEKLKQLQQSDAVIDQFKELEYDLCPACLAPIASHEVQGACALCKSPFDHEETKTRSLKLINEFARQLDQSQSLQQSRRKELSELREKLAVTTAAWEQAGRHYSVAVKSPTTEMRLKLRDLSRQAGYLTRQLEDLSGKAGIVQQLAELSQAKENLNKEISDLKQLLQFEKARNIGQVAVARAKISEIVIDFLRRDLARQSTFASASEVTFEFDGDRVAVNGDSFFSASSMVYLKNSFLAAFAFAAANDPGFKHPRFLLMDTVEDKGMEPERSQNFQRLLHKYSKEAKSDHQVIIATSMIAPELNIDELTIGQFYTHERRTLSV